VSKSSSPSSRRGWTRQEAETLLSSLRGVISARVVLDGEGGLEEIHLLTTQEVSPARSIRNVESALLAHFDLPLDHGRITVAQTRPRAQGKPDGEPVEPLHAGAEEGVGSRKLSPSAFHGRAAPDVEEVPAGERGPRILFISHRAETERSQRVRMQVVISWRRRRYLGEASGPDLPRPRMEALAGATLRAVEQALSDELRTRRSGLPVLALDLGGVQLVQAFDRSFVLVAVHALYGHRITQLAGAAAQEDTSQREVVLATLQAVDRWVRGR